MKNDQAFMAGSSFQAGSLASLRNEVEMTPSAFCRPAGRSALAIDAEALSRSQTGLQLSSDARRRACAAMAGDPSNTRISAPEFFRVEICASTERSEASNVVSATIILAQ